MRAVLHGYDGHLPVGGMRRTYNYHLHLLPLYHFCNITIPFYAKADCCSGYLLRIAALHSYQRCFFNIF